MKQCSTCKKFKQLSEFYKDKSRKDGLHHHCKNCLKNFKMKTKEHDKLLSKKRRIRNPEKVILLGIKQRCKNIKSTAYIYYGKKGIKNYLSLKDIKFLMKRDHYWDLKNPTIDRKNSKGNYTLNNCEFIELGKNTAKRNKEYTRTILQYTKNGKFIKEWDSIILASLHYKCTPSNISGVLRGLWHTAKGYKWKYKEQRRVSK